MKPLKCPTRGKDWPKIDGVEKKEIYNPHLMIHLAINGEELKKLQFCCEFVEQFIKKADESHDRLCEQFDLTQDDVYWFGDEWSFKLRRMMEEEYNKRMEIPHD